MADEPESPENPDAGIDLQLGRRQLRPFTEERLAAARERWRELAGEDEFVVELTALFDWCTGHLFPQAGDSQARELYDPELDQTDAILEVIDSRRGAKLLKFYVSPEFWGVELDRAAITRIAGLYGEAFAQVISDGIIRGTGLVKIYGRDALMLMLLQGLQNRWPADRVGWDAAMRVGGLQFLVRVRSISAMTTTQFEAVLDAVQGAFAQLSPAQVADLVMEPVVELRHQALAAA